MNTDNIFKIPQCQEDMDFLLLYKSHFCAFFNHICWEPFYETRVFTHCDHSVPGRLWSIIGKWPPPGLAMAIIRSSFQLRESVCIVVYRQYKFLKTISYCTGRTDKQKRSREPPFSMFRVSGFSCIRFSPVFQYFLPQLKFANVRSMPLL